MFYKKNFYQIRSNEYILNKLEKEKKSISYYSLLFFNISEIKDFVKKIDKKTIIVGESFLCDKAICVFLEGKYKFGKVLIFLEIIGHIDINRKFEALNLYDILFIRISKSGISVKTVVILKYLHNI